MARIKPTGDTLESYYLNNRKARVRDRDNPDMIGELIAYGDQQCLVRWDGFPNSQAWLTSHLVPHASSRIRPA